MQYVVVYTSIAGQHASFGPFSTHEDAMKWMQNDMDWASKTMKLARDIKPVTWIDGGDRCGIENVGEWAVVDLVPPGKHK